MTSNEHDCFVYAVSQLHYVSLMVKWETDTIWISLPAFNSMASKWNTLVNSVRSILPLVVKIEITIGLPLILLTHDCSVSPVMSNCNAVCFPRPSGPYRTNEVHSGITPYKWNESRLVKQNTIIHIEMVHLNFIAVALFLKFQLTVTYNEEGFRLLSAEVVPVMKDGH